MAPKEAGGLCCVSHHFRLSPPETAMSKEERSPNRPSGGDACSTEDIGKCAHALLLEHPENPTAGPPEHRLYFKCIPQP